MLQNDKGGGGFRFFNLASSLLEKDKWGKGIVSKQDSEQQKEDAS